jgi:hypothetical protein
LTAVVSLMDEIWRVAFRDWDEVMASDAELKHDPTEAEMAADAQAIAEAQRRVLHPPQSDLF